MPVLLLKRLEKVPVSLIAVVVAMLCVTVFNLDSVGVKVLGKIPQGLRYLSRAIASIAEVTTGSA